MIVRTRRDRSEKLREDQYREGYTRSLGRRREGDGDNFEHMWEQVKWGMVEIARGVCGSVRVGRKNPNCVQWND